ncbi:hypothetical protein MHC_04080 [Mycoplasma haemocanis str. Illinois]|uniref:Uncharacterized protein n=1 Tax=Mycoplasma haemocanis (strain Illinois) TaxID=1111676 RepID=H6N7Q0_MYCHN|nr:hypothetical protein [Mycoplasma haemocanis]AEW45672.1 hypothetical protein MHC_04080 [Mycoplasma haemocanis str. Illinois]
MSKGRILLGIGGAGVTTLAALFGTSQVKERNYQTKMRKFRETAKKVNGYLNEASWGDAKIYDPEHVIWDKRFRYLESTMWGDANLVHFSEDAKNSLDGFKNFCFEKMESNAEELRGQWGTSPTNIPATQGYWEHCLINNQEFRQLNEKYP